MLFSTVMDQFLHNIGMTRKSIHSSEPKILVLKQLDFLSRGFKKINNSLLYRESF